MSSPLRVESVALIGAAEHHVWRLPKGVTVIVGDSGGGKTSFLNLIKYGLGGDAPITKTLEDAARGVEVAIQAGDQNLTLSRDFHSQKSVVRVSAGDADRVEYSVRNGQRRPWISDLLLGAVGIPAVRVPTSRQSTSHRLTSISFQDVFAYAYLDQDSIDQETVHDQESYGAGAKRPWTFELLRRIIDGETAHLEARKEEIAEQTAVRRKRLGEVEAFIQATAVPASLGEVGQRLEEIQGSERETEKRLRFLEAEATNLAARQTTEGTLRDESEEELADARQDLAVLRSELAEVRRAGNQVQRDLIAAREGSAARSVLQGLPYLVCPRCEQSLESRGVDESVCFVCRQPETEIETEDFSAAGLEAQLRETTGIKDQLEAAIAEARRRIEKLTAQGMERSQAVATAKDEVTSNIRREILELQGELGALRGERETLKAGPPIEKALEQERSDLAVSEPEIGRIADQAEARRRELSADGRARVEDLSTLFSEILHDFSLPWLATAEIDRQTYLPLVNGLGLKAISSGGMKTTTNVAYYLAVFGLGLRDSEILTPNFLMLDSIRKDSGSGAKDLARSDRIYAYLRTLQELRGGSTPASREFQLLVVDNDLPDAFERAFNTMRIDPDSPLVRIPA